MQASNLIKNLETHDVTFSLIDLQPVQRIGARFKET